MRTWFRRFAAILVSVLVVSTLWAVPANAITGGEPDGNRHPNVGLILFYDADGRFRCSATLISPTVLITAAHCTDGTLGKTLVTFDSVIAEQPPSPFPVAADPAAGFTQAEIQAAVICPAPQTPIPTIRTLPTRPIGMTSVSSFSTSR